MIHNDGAKPIYIQIAEWLETEILNGHLPVDAKVYSQYKLADMFTINPATAAKGLTILTDEHILYGKRGLGKFVAKEAIAIIKDKRFNQTLQRLLQDTVQEAIDLDINEATLLGMLKRVYQQEKGEDT